MFVSYIKGGMQTKGIWKQGPQANICVQEAREWEVGKAPQWGTSWFSTFRLEDWDGLAM